MALYKFVLIPYNFFVSLPHITYFLMTHYTFFQKSCRACFLEFINASYFIHLYPATVHCLAFQHIVLRKHTCLYLVGNSGMTWASTHDRNRISNCCLIKIWTNGRQTELWDLILRILWVMKCRESNQSPADRLDCNIFFVYAFFS